MDSMPGAFPFQTGTSTPPVPLISSVIAPVLISVRNSLTSRRASFQRDILDKLALLSAMYLALVYLYDCSLLMLLLRGMTHWNISHKNTLEQLPVTRRMLSTMTLHSIVITNILCAVLHFIREIPSSEPNGFIYGHHSIQIIGQTQITDKMWFYLLDLAIFFSQIMIYAAHYYRRNLEEDTTEKDGDGSQGTIVALRIDLIDSIVPEHITLPEMLADDAEETERFQRFQESVFGAGGLLEEDTPTYGATTYG